jgi:hypothetical protein
MEVSTLPMTFFFFFCFCFDFYIWLDISGPISRIISRLSLTSGIIPYNDKLRKHCKERVYTITYSPSNILYYKHPFLLLKFTLYLRNSFITADLLQKFVCQTNSLIIRKPTGVWVDEHMLQRNNGVVD